MSDRVKNDTDQDRPPESQSRDEDRYATDPRTGLRYVKRRPGERTVTSEEIRKLLEDFP